MIPTIDNPYDTIVVHNNAKYLLKQNYLMLNVNKYLKQ